MSQLNSISSLTKFNFSLLSLEQKIAIKNEGRPTPNLIIVKESKGKDRTIKRNFNIDTYDKNDWICGCDITNKLFCFPCVIFNRSNEMSWSKIGIDDLSHLSAKIKSHEKTQTHINAQLSLKLLGKQDIRQELSSAFRLNIQKYNEQVKENRYILSKIIDCIRFCGAFELALRGHGETADSVNPEVFKGLINFTAELDYALKTHLEKATVFKDVLTDKNKLITQSYDGANVMSGHISGVQTFIKSEYPNAHYVHCYAHQLNLIMKAASCKSKETRIFFSNLTDITNFFSRSPQRVQVLDQIVKKRLPKTVETRWNFNSRVVNTVYENRELLIECMDKIETTSNQTTTINQAGALRRMLLESTFIYWLNVFHRIMPHLDILYNQLQKRSTSPVEINNAINNFEINIQKERDNLDNIQVDEGESVKRRRENIYLTRNIIAKEVCDTIIVIYKRNDFKKISTAVHLLKFIIENQLLDTFSETSKLLKIVITIPMTSAEAERSFSTLKRIKTFLRSTMSEDRLSALSMLSIEKLMIKNIPDFNEKVIDISHYQLPLQQPRYFGNPYVLDRYLELEQYHSLEEMDIFGSTITALHLLVFEVDLVSILYS
ncbi:hypothetical protein QTP88_008044 [Uroleucon formosanum]